MQTTFRRATRAILAAAALAVLLAAPARADVYVTESFTGATAPGWTLSGDAILTPNLTGTGNNAPDADGSGWLRLTSAAGSQAGAAVYNTAFPSTQGVVAEFDSAAWGGTGADGISFFLLDGSVATPTLGANGQGLGYANDCSHDGLSKGYLAVGIDEYGNFSEPGGFCKNGPGRAPQSFTIRGPGDGRNADSTGTQYGFLAKSTLPAGSKIDGTSRASVHRYSLYISPDHKVSLSWRPTSGGAWQPLLTDVAIPGTAPSTFKLGFSGSTGGSTNYHEVRNLVVGPPVNLSVDNVGGGAYARRGSTVSYTVVATNHGPNPAIGATVADTVPAALQDVTWTCAADGGASCATASGAGNAISTLADLPVDGSVTLTITGTVAAGATGAFANDASVTAPSTVIDTDASDDAQSATTTVNDPPELTAAATALAYSENDAATPVDPALTATDPDGAISAGSVAITGHYAEGEDVLGYAKPSGSPIDGSFDAATGVLGLSGSGTPAQWQAALRAVAYRDLSDGPSTADRTITFRLDDPPGLHGSATRTVSVAAVADAPTLATTPTALAYTEGDGAVAVDPGVTPADADGALAGATVTISGGYVEGEDVLALPALAGNPVTASWDAATGTLALSGSSDPADYRAALRAVTYEDGSQDPATAGRTVTFAVTDGASSAQDTRAIGLTAVDDAPAVHASPGTLAISESGAPVAADPGVAVGDAEDAIASATVAVADGYDPGRDVLALAPLAGNPVTAAWDAGTGTLALTGPATAVQMQAALRAVTLRSTSAAPGTRRLRFAVVDDGGASAYDDRAVAVALRPPVDVTAPATTGVLRVGGTVSGVRGDWSGTAPIAYAYAWERCDAATCARIAGATSLDYVIAPADAGHELRLVVSAANAVPGSVEAISARTAVVAPALTAPRIERGPAASTTATTAAFTLRGEPGAELQCSLDGGAWTPCASAHSRSGLPLGEHVLRVRQVLDGLTSPEAADRWTVVAAPAASGIVAKVPAADGRVRERGGAIGAVCGLAGVAMRSCDVAVTATVTVHGHRRTIVVGRGSAHGARAGAERRVRITLTRAGRELLSRTGHLDARFAFTTVDAAGHAHAAGRRARIQARLLVTVRRHFAVDDPRLTSTAKAFLARLAARYPYATHLRCVGRADGTATDAHGLWLGRHRARNACRFLARHGLNAGRRIVSYGTRRPVATNRTAAGRAANRVVVVTLSN